jgi:hypothetical protein
MHGPMNVKSVLLFAKLIKGTSQNSIPVQFSPLHILSHFPRSFNEVPVYAVHPKRQFSHPHYISNAHT